MAEQHRHIWAPRAFHPDTISDGKQFISDATGTMVVAYCPRSFTGGVLIHGVWGMWSPLRFSNFLDILRERGISVNETSADYATWIHACTSDIKRSKHVH